MKYTLKFIVTLFMFVLIFTPITTQAKESAVIVFDIKKNKKALVKVKKTVVDPRPTLCKTYAENAVKQEHIDIEEECGFEGKFWTTEDATHFDWCMSQEIGSKLPEEESKKRISQLEKCKTDKNAVKIKTVKKVKRMGKLEFNFSNKLALWGVYRNDERVAKHRSGHGKLALEAGVYTIKSRKNLFEPFEVTIKKGETLVVDK